MTLTEAVEFLEKHGVHVSLFTDHKFIKDVAELLQKKDKELETQRERMCVRDHCPTCGEAMLDISPSTNEPFCAICPICSTENKRE